MTILTWDPKSYPEYWEYTENLEHASTKEEKQYWFTMRCNFIHKPFMDALKTAKQCEPIDFTQINKLTEQDWDWEVGAFELCQHSL